MLSCSCIGHAQPHMENLGRGVVALPYETSKVFISWRILAPDPDDIAFNIYRKSSTSELLRLNHKPLNRETHFIDSLADLSKTNSWFIQSIGSDDKGNAINGFVIKAGSSVQQYLSIPLKTPPGYTPNDASVGDLDGD